MIRTVHEGRAPFRLFTIAVLFSGGVILGLGAHACHSYWVTKVLVFRELRLKELEGIIMRLDEVLTMSAHMAATSGDPEWEARYRRFEPELDQAIKEVIRLTPEVYRNSAPEETDQANTRLVAMEHQAFDLVRQHRFEEAQGILSSEAYAEQKWVYAEGMKRLMVSLRRHTERLLASERRKAFWFVTLALVVAPLLVCVWLVMLRVLRTWRRLVLDHVQALLKKDEELSELNANLDQTVVVRTAELSQANAQLENEVSQRKRLEETLWESANELAHANAGLLQRQKVMQSLLEDVQTAKVRLEEQGQQLVLANKRLQELAGLKDEFVAKVSHELRTPLTSIKEGVSLIVDGALGATTTEQQDFLKTIDGDIDRLAELVNNMLDLSKIEAGRMRLLRVRSRIRELIDSLVRSYQPILGHRKVQTDYADVPPVFADPNRMFQVFSNLLSNAIKFTEEEGTITVRVFRQNSMVAVAVQDNGPGIAPEDLSKLFQKFSQIGPHGGGRPRGTGLGLVVCKELTELHGGRIEVASELERGTTFTVVLPIYTDAVAMAEAFSELAQLDPSEGQRVGLIAIQAVGLLDPQASPPSIVAAERLADEVRRQVHRGDVVLAIEPSWVVVLAHTDLTGLQAIAKRLGQRLSHNGRMSFGAAASPGDGPDADTLFERAVARVGQEPPWPVSSDPESAITETKS